MLQGAHAEFVQMPNMQPQYHEYGDDLPAPRSRHRSPADAAAVPRHQSPCLLQRLLRQVKCKVPLAWLEVRSVSLAAY